MQIQCPSCSKVVDVPDGSAGQVVACPECGGQMQVPAAEPAAAPTLSAASAASDPTKQCPYCGETVLAVARRCKHCKEEIPEGGDEASIRKGLAAKEEKIAQQLASGGMPPISYLAGGKFRLSTIILAVVTAACAFMVVFGTVVSRGSDGEALVIFGILFGIIFAIGTLVMFVRDLKTPSSGRRTTPEKGLLAFLRAVQFNRYKYAYACLLDGEKQGRRRRRAMSSVKVSAGSFSFDSLGGFREYWKGMAQPSMTANRRMRVSRIKTLRVVGDYAQVQAGLSFENSPVSLGVIIILLLFLWPLALILAIVATTASKKEKVTITKLLRKVKGQWYVVNGELASPEDRAINVAAELAGK